MKVAALVVLFTVTSALYADGPITYSVLYSFSASGADGSNPYSGLVRGANGALYGTTPSGGTGNDGTVFELKPPDVAGEPWSHRTIHSFMGYPDGYVPYGALIIGADGALYGTTYGGGTGVESQGTVYRLIPPLDGSGQWSEELLYSFTGHLDGANPYTALTAGPGGILYGTTGAGGSSERGVAFQLTPPAALGGAWTETVIYTFIGRTEGGIEDGAGPQCTLVPGRNGALYGTTTEGGATDLGTVFELRPPSQPDGVWTESVLYSLGLKKGYGAGIAIALGDDGSIFGTTQYGGASPNSLFSGTLYQLAPPVPGSNEWIATILHSFSGVNGEGDGPLGGVVKGPNGALFGVNLAGADGTVYEFTPPPIQGEPWTEKILHHFLGAPDDGSGPIGTLIIGSNGNLYGTTTVGGTAGYGTAFELKF